jgi:hypothetical protein
MRTNVQGKRFPIKGLALTTAVQPLLLATQSEYGMFEHFRKFPWVLEPLLYDNETMLLASLKEKVIEPAEAKAKEQATKWV